MSEEESLRYWMKCMSEAAGYGGGKYISERLDMPQTTVSKLLSGKTKFDVKTIRAIAMLQASKDTFYQTCPIKWEHTAGPYVFRCRINGVEEIITWQKKV
jgi:hypothetical protein